MTGAGASPRRLSIAQVFVWTLWSVMLSSQLALAMHFAHNVPFQDEFGFADVLAGRLSQSLSWLWTQHAEHRVPLAKLVWLGTLRVSGYDFRVGNVFTVLSLAGASAALIRTAASIRGRTSVTDGFFPLVFLNPGFGLLVVWWWCVNHVFAPLVVCAMLMLVVGTTGPVPAPRALLVGACILALVSCGPGGLPYAVVFAAWLGYWGARAWRSPESGGRRNALTAWVLAALGILLVALYVASFDSKTPFPASPHWLTSLVTTVRLVPLGLGMGVVGPYWTLAGAAILVLGLATIALVVARWRADPAGRPRWTALLLYLVAAGGPALVVGRARAGMPPEYLGGQGQHGLLLVPGLCAIYFAWLLGGSPRARALGPAALFLASALLLLPNFAAGLETMRYFSDGMEQFQRDALNAMPPALAAERHRAFLLSARGPSDERPQTERLAASMRSLQRAGFYPFVRMLPDSAVQSVSLSPEPSAIEGAVPIGGGFRGTGGRPCLAYALPGRRLVGGLRVTFSIDAPASGRASFRVGWGDGDCAASPRRGEYDLFHVDRDGLERTRSVWINRTVDRVCVCPDGQPCDFRISSVELLVPH